MKSPSSTYYYHYDVHGNTLKVTDTNQDTKITYTYDTLGNITSQTNPDSIPNPFTFMGASQTILDTETNLYFSSGYYNPQTGTLLQGTGSPAMPNPTSISTINSMSTSSLPEAQLLSHSITSATTAGSSSGGEPGSFSPPAGPEEGIANAGKRDIPDVTATLSLVGADNMPMYSDAFIGTIPIPTIGGGGEILPGDKIQPTPPKFDPPPTTDTDGGDNPIKPEDPREMDFTGDDYIPIEPPGYTPPDLIPVTPKTGDDIYDDMTRSDDNQQYDWVIRGVDGHIIACKVNKTGQIITYGIDDNGNCIGPYLTYDPKDRSQFEQNWMKIAIFCNNDERISIKMFAGKVETGGVICLRMTDGSWLGVATSLEGKRSIVSARNDEEVGWTSNPKDYDPNNDIAFISIYQGNDKYDWVSDQTYYKQGENKWNFQYIDYENQPIPNVVVEIGQNFHWPGWPTEQP